jgi:protoporphyrin/coproporphyrin ferrochelatase
MKLAVVLFNLGGPDSLDAVAPFLRNLFSDKAIITLPWILRWPIAQIIAGRRAPFAREIYAKIGGRSPILEETQAQGRALESVLDKRGFEARAFIAMRYWKPFSAEAAAAVAAFAPDRIVLLPLYPQFSTTTSASSLDAWAKAAAGAGISARQSRVCCYPQGPGFIAAQTTLIREALARAKPGVDYRLLLSAHGLPKRTVLRGDPYPGQVEKTAAAIVDRLGIKGLDWAVCYQSRVGPLEWIGPSTDAEIARAGAEAKGVVVAPIAFVSEHSETLVELDIDYAKLARESGVRDYIRVPAAGTRAEFIAGLADLVEKAIDAGVASCAGGRICPLEASGCGWGKT